MSTSALRDRVWFHIVLLVGCVFLLRGWPVPDFGESVYLLALIKHWNPDYLAHDWAFSEWQNRHFVFNALFGALTPWVSLEALGWLGRLLCWPFVLLALLQLGKSFALPLWMSSLSIFLWILLGQTGQSIVAGSWMLGGFEAKCLGYALLLFALHGFLQSRYWLPACLLGLAFSLHAAVGLFGGIAVYFALIVLKTPWSRLFGCMGLTLLCALPGLIAALPILLTSNPYAAENWEFLALFRVPHHLDPISWPHRDILTVYILFGFNLLVCLEDRDNVKLRFLAWFQGGMGLIFTLGLALRWLEAYTWLQFTPFRLFPLFVPLLFYLHLMYYLRHQSINPLRPRLIAVGILALLCLNNPVGTLVDKVRMTHKRWTASDDSLGRALDWVASNTPTEAVVVAPPWQFDSFYRAQRAQVANWKMIPYGRVQTWRVRLESLVGTDWRAVQRDGAAAMAAHYNRLTPDEIMAIREAYGGDFLVSAGTYDFPVLYDGGPYRVYGLPPRR